MDRLLIICCVIFFLFNIILSKTASSQFCDPDILPIESWEIQYRNRGNRCEGFYRSKLSAGSIEVVGVVRGRFDFNLDKNEIVEVSSAVNTAIPINVRAVSIPIKTYYRMDSKIDPNQILIWPIGDVVYIKKLSAQKIGVLGWIENENDNGGEKVYIPLNLIPKLASPATDSKTRLYFRTSVDVEIVKWRFSDSLDPNCSKLSSWMNTIREGYRVGEPICIELTQTLTGDLYVEVAAKEKDVYNWMKKEISVILR